MNLEMEKAFDMMLGNPSMTENPIKHCVILALRDYLRSGKKLDDLEMFIFVRAYAEQKKLKKAA